MENEVEELTSLSSPDEDSKGKKTSRNVKNECKNTLEAQDDKDNADAHLNRRDIHRVGLEQNGCIGAELNFDEAAQSEAARDKLLHIERALSEDPVNASKLKEFALSEGGLLNDSVRKRVWPKLLGLDTQAATDPPSQNVLEAHAEYHQVVLDVNRSLKRFPPGQLFHELLSVVELAEDAETVCEKLSYSKRIPYEQRLALQDQLTRLILRVIIKYPHLRYYQGYHDVAVTFLLVVGEAAAFQIMEKLSTEHLKELMEPTMDKTSRLLNYIYPLMKRMHASLYDYMERAGVGTMFCLPWFLTWYGHSLNQYKDVVRLYDFFLASPPLLPLYLATVLVVHRKDEIFAQECDMASIHSLLSQIPDDLPFEKLLKEALDLYELYPPESIEAEVQERFNRELQLRRYDDTPRVPRIRRHTIGALWQHITEMNRMLPHWILIPRVRVPRFHTRFVLATTTAAVVGLYAYFRMAEALDLDCSIPVR